MVRQGWKGQKVVILGAARQGLALARYLARHGAAVVLNDQRPIGDLAEARETLADLGTAVEWVCGGHPLSVLAGADLVCVSGGIPLDKPVVVEAHRRGIPLSNDSQIFLEAAACTVIGITGSAGKTTTTTLVGRIAEAAEQMPTGPYRKAWVGGNIGSPLISTVDQMGPDDLAIMELSSFQLELMTRSPQVAAVLNLTPNHLDRHGSMQAYSAAKARILEFQGEDGLAVLGRDDPGAWDLLPKARGRVISFGLSGDHQPDGWQLEGGYPGTYLQKGRLYYWDGERSVQLMEQARISLRGEHNLLNVLAASAIAIAAGLPVEAITAGVEGFGGVPHRLEFVRRWAGADWYNDSIATAPERAMAAIRSFEEPLVVLAGGRDKNLPWEDFAALVERRVEHLVVFGEAAEKIVRAVEAIADRQAGTRPALTRCAGLEQAVQAAARIVRPGQVVLLSPGGTSFDEFRDFEERGECFRRLVKDL